VIFQKFPRTGTARWSAGYADNVDALDALIASGALPDLSFPWWDVRLQPVPGTGRGSGDGRPIEVADSAALVVLVQPLARAQLDRRQAHRATRGYGPGMLTRVVARRSHAGRIVRGYPWRALTARADAQSRAAAEGSVEAGRGLCGQLD
jgi:gamma-glutamyl:cysteine ligase YbdK (ATP-grasp superfamily)